MAGADHDHVELFGELPHFVRKPQALEGTSVPGVVIYFSNLLNRPAALIVVTSFPYQELA
jgi:hypothetical protein